MKTENRLTKTIIFSLLIMLNACNRQPDTSTPEVEATPLPVTETTGAPLVETTEPTVVPVTPAIPAEPASIIFYNGNLITMQPDLPVVQALAVRAGVILAVGSDEQVLALQGPETSLVDLQGGTLMPGFIDGHTHLLTFYGRMDQTFEEAQQIALSHGFTMLSEMWANEDVVQSFLQAEQQGRLRLRVNIFPSYNDGILGPDHRRLLLKTWYPAHAPILDPEKLVRIPGIKIFVDGDNTGNTRGCWALSAPFEPGSDALNRGACNTPSGDLYWEQDELNQTVRAAQETGYRVAFHAMGDRAIETALNAIEYALQGESNEIHRHQIDHNSLIRPDLLPRYKALDVAATVRGHIELCNLSDLEPEFGAERIAWYGNRYELPNLGIHAALETDYGWKLDPNNRFDQRTLDPFMHLYGLVTHRYASAEDKSCAPDARLTGKLISIQRALEMMTTEPAWLVSMEQQVGSLEVGKYADLILLSGDPLTIDPNQLKDLSVLMTMVAGKVEYCAEGRQALCP